MCHLGGADGLSRVTAWQPAIMRFLRDALRAGRCRRPNSRLVREALLTFPAVIEVLALERGRVLATADSRLQGDPSSSLRRCPPRGWLGN